MPASSESLLHACFFDQPRTLRKKLAGLGAGEREQLFRQLQEPIQALRGACRYNSEAYRFSQGPDGSWGVAETYLTNIAVVWPEVARHLDDLPAWIISAKICLHTARDAAGLVLRLQQLQIALAPRQQLFIGIRPGKNMPFEPVSDREQEWPYVLGTTLLDRPEDWLRQAFADFCEKLPQLPTRRGAARLLRDTLRAHPDWADEILPHVGQYMYADGLYEEDLDAYPANMIMAGMAHEPDKPPFTNAFEARPDKLRQRLLEPDIPRLELLTLLLHRFQAAARPVRAKAWLRLYQSLEPSPDEIRRLGPLWLQLLFAPQAEAVKQAIKMLRPAIKAGELDQDFGLLLQGAQLSLQQAIPAAAASGWDLFKTLAVRHRDKSALLLESLAQALNSPHAKVRLLMLEWLANQPGPRPAELNTALHALRDSGQTSLPEQEILARLLPPETAPPVAAAPAMARLSGPLPPSRQRYAQALSAAHTLQDLPAMAADWGFYAEDPPMELPPDSFALAAEFCRGAHDGLTPLQLERLIAGVLAHRVGSETADLRKRLDPVFQLMNQWQQPEVGEELYHVPMRSLHLAHLAYGWLNQGLRPAFHQASASYRELQLSQPLDFCLMQRVGLALRALSEGRRSLLATPDYVTGWIEPDSFASRLLEHLPTGLDSDDLGLALLRLPPPAQRTDLWPALLPQLDRIAHPLQRAALEIALGPESHLPPALKRFDDVITRNPPDDWILQIRFHTTQPRDTEPNRIFRLLNRAVLARTGLTDACAALPELKGLRQDQLLLNGGIDHSQWRKLASHFMEEIKQILFNQPEVEGLPEGMALPEPRQRMLRLGKLSNGQSLLEAFWHPGGHPPHPFGGDPSLAHMLEPHALPYPQMAAHVVEWLGPMYQPGYGFGFAPSDLVDPLSAYMPMLAQKLWEGAIGSLRQLEDQKPEKHLFAAALLDLGRRAYVRVLPQDLEWLTPLLTSRHPGQVEAVLGLLESLLLDGRIPAGILAGFWADRLAGPAEGFKYLLEAARNWQAQGPACELVLLWALDKLWTGRTPASRNLGRLLELQAQLLQRHGLAPQSPDAREALALLAQGKKGQPQTLARLILAMKPQATIEARLLEALRAQLG